MAKLRFATQVGPLQIKPRREGRFHKWVTFPELSIRPSSQSVESDPWKMVVPENKLF